MRFHGAVGYAETQQATSPGVFEEIITERTYFGDVISASRRLETPVETLNNNVALENSIAIVADAFALSNFTTMRYVTWNGQRWKITNVEIRRPRLVLTIGELWNGDTPGAPGGS
jgi:hypothetical protein